MQDAAARPLVIRVHGIATAIAVCWRPPHGWRSSHGSRHFTRDGAVVREPRIVFVQSSGGGLTIARRAAALGRPATIDVLNINILLLTLMTDGRQPRRQDFLGWKLNGVVTD